MFGAENTDQKVLSEEQLEAMFIDMDDFEIPDEDEPDMLFQREFNF